MVNGEAEMAIDSYLMALSELEEGVGNREVLKIKLEALGATEAEAADVDNGAGGGGM